MPESGFHANAFRMRCPFSICFRYSLEGCVGRTAVWSFVAEKLLYDPYRVKRSEQSDCTSMSSCPSSVALLGYRQRHEVP
jgi:hypothetical protein